MKIRASCVFNLESIRALTRLTLFGKRNPAKRMIGWSIVYAIVLAVQIADVAALGWSSTMIRLMMVLVATWLLMCFLYFFLPRIRYNSLAKMKELVNEYTFCDKSMIVATQGDLYNGESEIQYSLLFKVMETSRYFFIWQNKNQVFVVDKATICGGAEEEIRGKLSSYLGKKYTLCKY